MSDTVRPGPSRQESRQDSRQESRPDSRQDSRQDSVDVAVVQRWLRAFAAEVRAQRDLLTELDSAIGDADHGANMDRGMAAVVAKLDDAGSADAGSAGAGATGAGAGASAAPGALAGLFKQTGMTLISSVGGASGPLYGTLFLRMATAAGDAAALEPEGFAAALRAGLEGVVARGKAEAGDKTMFDALAPACDALEQALADGSGLAEALQLASAAADTGRDGTVPMLARKGRASYLGERSVGHQDPGATSAALLVAAVAQVLSAAVGDRG